MTIRKDRGTRGAVDEARIAAPAGEIRLARGEDPERDGRRETPAQVAHRDDAVFAGLHADPDAHPHMTFAVGYRARRILRDLPCASFCEHHLVPFTAPAHSGYIPNGRGVGLAKLARVVEGYARRPQVQERPTGAIAAALLRTPRPDGVAVLIEAPHTCMTIRSVHKPGATMVTSAVRGGFRERAGGGAGIFALVGHTTRGGATS